MSILGIMRPRLSGHFRLLATKLDGTQRVVADWQDNLILNAGLNRIGSGWIASHCQVGTGSTAPTNADTALQSFLVSTGTVITNTYGSMTSSPYYAYATRTYRFAIGVAAGNLAEVGIGWSASTGSLFSRALIKDGGGTPTPITILGDEILDVQYELRMYPPEVDVTGTISAGGDSYDYVLRAAAVTGSVWNQFGLYILMTATGGSGTVSYQSLFYEGGIAAITSQPSGASGPSGLYASPATYGNNNYYRDYSITATFDQANFTTGVGAGSIYTPLGQYQIGFTPKLTKNNTKSLTITIRIAWARKTL